MTATVSDPGMWAYCSIATTLSFLFLLLPRVPESWSGAQAGLLGLQRTGALQAVSED